MLLLGTDGKRSLIHPKLHMPYTEGVSVSELFILTVATGL